MLSLDVVTTGNGAAVTLVAYRAREFFTWKISVPQGSQPIALKDSFLNRGACPYRERVVYVPSVRRILQLKLLFKRPYDVPAKLRSVPANEHTCVNCLPSTIDVDLSGSIHHLMFLCPGHLNPSNVLCSMPDV